MTSEFEAIIASLNAEIKEIEDLCFITRNTGLQHATLDRFRQMHETVKNAKQRAIEAEEESFANLFLGFQCVLQALKAELAMYLLLKQDKPDEAWDCLVTAQAGALAAQRAHPGFRHLLQHFERLETFERTVFPPQVFFSAGLLVKRQECSICASEYGHCLHLAGLPYMGEFCSIVARDLEPDHVAIVEHPADKRCRVVEYSDKGITTNRMTRVKRDMDSRTEAEPFENTFYASGPIMVSSGPRKGID